MDDVAAESDAACWSLAFFCDGGSEGEGSEAGEEEEEDVVVGARGDEMAVVGEIMKQARRGVARAGGGTLQVCWRFSGRGRQRRQVGEVRSKPRRRVAEQASKRE